jgi:hypothetical protein
MLMCKKLNPYLDKINPIHVELASEAQHARSAKHATIAATALSKAEPAA